MNRSSSSPAVPELPRESLLWPSAAYLEYVERLRQAVGSTVYLTEVRMADIHASAELSDKGYELLGVVDFPRPDPQRRLYPHLILLDDGRGINLGRIARISTNTPFDPPPDDLLYLERELSDRELFREQRMSPERIARTSKIMLGGMLGRQRETEQLIEQAKEDAFKPLLETK